MPEYVNLYSKGPFLSDGLVHEIVTLTVLMLWLDVEVMVISVTDPGAVWGEQEWSTCMHLVISFLMTQRRMKLVRAQTNSLTPDIY